MIRWCFIWIMLITELAAAQDSCRGQYDLPVQYLSVKGTKLAYVEKGRGQVVIMIHGLGGNLSHWMKNIEGLSKNFRCIGVDLPGYGFSEKDFDTRGLDHLTYYSEILGQFIKKKKLKNVVLAGHSMGGQVAIITSLQYPKLVKKLILVSPAGLETFNENETAILINASKPQVYQNQDSVSISRSYQLNFYKMTGEVQKLVDQRIKLKSCVDFIKYTEAVSNGVKGMLAQPVHNSLQKIHQKVLLVYGANDALIPNRFLHPQLKLEDLLKDFLLLVPNAVVKTIPEAGHLVQYEKPLELNQLIKNFLQ
jgi:pimeloyl-ACP methyl ester carboxylesterase